jgi:hypothetical protein
VNGRVPSWAGQGNDRISAHGRDPPL